MDFWNLYADFYICYYCIKSYHSNKNHKKIIGQDNKNLIIAHKQVVYVVVLISIIYLVPITGMVISAFINFIFIYIIGFSMLLLTIPVTYLIIIPLVDKQKLKHIEEVFEEDSEYAKNKREKLNNTK